MNKKTLIVFLIVIVVPALLAVIYFYISKSEEKTISGVGDEIINKNAGDTTIKISLISIKAEGASKKTDKNYNFAEFCNEPLVTKEIEEIERQGAEVVCNSTGDGWALQTRLLTGGYICADSTSLQDKKSDQTLGNSTICP